MKKAFVNATIMPIEGDIILSRILTYIKMKYIMFATRKHFGLKNHLL